jgi:hypothetical protein
LKRQTIRDLDSAEPRERQHTSNEGPTRWAPDDLDGEEGDGGKLAVVFEPATVPELASMTAR